MCVVSVQIGGFLSTLSLRRATLGRTVSFSAGRISIHALLAESDARKNSKCPCLPISIHALLAESDYIHVNTFLEIFKFLSTLSLRRATDGVRSTFVLIVDFYPRSPCGERHDYVRYCIRAREISIHALLAESDVVDSVILAGSTLFLSTLSLRRATQRSD